MLTDEQKAMRATGLGASEIPAVLGLVPWWRPIDVWLEKVGLAEPRPDSYPAELGRILEPHIYEWWKQEQTERGHTVEDGEPIGTVRDSKLGWLFATPDHVPYVRNRGQRRRQRRIVECKHAGTDVARRHWTVPETCPDYVDVQVQIQMRVLGLKSAEVAVWLDGVRKPKDIIVVPYAPRVVSAALRIAERFWFDHVIAGEPPEMDGSETWSRLLKQEFPRDVSPIADAPAHAHELVTRWRAADAAVKRADNERTEAQQKLCSIIGERGGIRDREHDYRATWYADKKGTRRFHVGRYGRGW